MSLDDDTYTSLDTGGLDEEKAIDVRFISIICSDGQLLQVNRAILTQSQLLKSVLDMDEEAQELRLQELTSVDMSTVVDYLTHHHTTPTPHTPIPRPLPAPSLRGIVSEWDANFIESLRYDELFRLLIAATYLVIPRLQELVSAQLGTLVMGKTPQGIRSALGVAEPTSAEIKELKKLFPGLT